MKITDEIHRVDGADHCNMFLVLGEELTLVEGGDPGDGRKALDTMAKLGFKPQDLKRVIVTHGHGDHINGLPEILGETQSQVFAHEADAEMIEKLFPLAGRLKDGEVIDLLGGLQVVHTPGHSPGSVCFYSPSRKVLFPGDLILNRGEFSGPIPRYTQDLALAHRSIRERVVPLDFEMLCVSHGVIITEGAGERVRALAATLA